MQQIARELEALLEDHKAGLLALPEEHLRTKPSPLKWSKKEIIGHLIDSAQANIRRFIVGQYEDTPRITYKQDKWVALSAYQQWDTPILIELWYGLNKQICAILSTMDAEMARRSVQTEAVHTIEWLAEDYIKHLRHHLHQVLELDPVPYP